MMLCRRQIKCLKREVSGSQHQEKQSTSATILAPSVETSSFHALIDEICLTLIFFSCLNDQL